MRGFTVIGLTNPKFDANVGGAMRAGMCYGADLIIVRGRRYKCMSTDTMKAWRHIPLIHAENFREVIPFDCVPVAVEILPNARSLVDYVHPERAFYIFGPEDGSLGKEITSWCRDVIYIPTKFCMNLASTVNVVLYDRMSKSYGKELTDARKPF